MWVNIVIGVSVCLQHTVDALAVHICDGALGVLGVICVWT